MTTIEQQIDAGELRDVIDETNIRRLHAAYVDAVNRAAWSEFHNLFLPDVELTVARGSSAPDTVVGPDAIGQLIGGYIAKYDFLVQVITNARIELRYRGDPDQAFARLFIAEFRQWTETGRYLESAGVYHDQYRRVDGTWFFARRRYDRLYVTAPAALETHPFPSDIDFDDPFAARSS
jgi:hypothetical protein